jgi:hypothetical protein
LNKNSRISNDEKIRKIEYNEEKNDIDSFPSFKFHMKPGASILSTYTQSATPEPDQAKDDPYSSSL